MNPNIATPAEALATPAVENFGPIVLAALFFIGLLSLAVLFARAESRVRRIKRQFYDKRRDVEQQYWHDRCEIDRERSAVPRGVITAQLNDTSPVHIPVTNCEIRDRRKITRLYY